MKDFRTLTVWQRAHELALTVYVLTRALPREEQYGITGQIRRAVASIPANVAEGCGRSGNGDFCRFLTIAMGSAVEVEYFLLLARDLGFVAEKEYRSTNDRVLEVQKMLASLIRKVEVSRCKE